MREKKMGMRTVLTRLLGIATVACALVATPGVAEAATTAVIPSNVKIAQTESTNPYVADTVTLEAGEDYVVGGEIKINHYVVKGGTEQDPTRIYLTGNASVGHWPGSIKDKRGSGYDELFVLDGGYIEFIGTNGNGRTPVYCNGKSFLSDNAGRKDGYGDGADKNRVPNSLNLKVSGIELITVGSGVSKRPIALYGTMVDGETATFDNVKVSKWDCTPNGATYGSSHAYSNIATEYEASPAPVTILSSANGAKSLDVAFSNCEFTDNEDDCAGALSVVGRGCRPKVVLNNCTFKNNQQESIWCKELNVQDKNEHTHAGNIVVNNADITLNGCTITSTQEAANYTQDMVMTSAIAVAKNSTCTLNNTQVSDTYAEGTYYHSDANTRRNTVYARGTVTLAGNTTITTNGEKGARGLALDTPGINYYGKLNIADTFTGKVQLSLKDDQLGAYAGTQWKLGTCGIEESDLRARVTTDDPSVGIGRTDDGYVYASRLPHEHVWSVEKAANSSYQLKVTCSGKMRPSDCSYKNGYAVELGIDGATPDKGKLGVTYSGGEVTPTLMMSNKDGYARDDIVSKGDVYISGSRYYKLTKWGDSAGEALEHVPTDAGIYRIESTVKVKGQEGDLTLAREFQIRPLELSKVSGLTFEFNDGGTDTTVDGEKARAYPWTGKTIKPSFSVKIYNYGSQSWSYFVKDNDYVIDGDSTYSTVSAIDPPPSSNSYFPYYQIYIKGTGNYTGSAYANWTITGTQFENVTAEGFEGVYDGQPHGVNISVSNAPADMTIEYSFDEGDSWTTEAKSYTDVQRNRKGEICSVTVDYRITAKDYVTKSGSVEIKITPARQPVPWRYIASEGTGVKVKDQSAHLLEDGSLSNLNKTYEWRKYGDTYWESIGAGKTSVDGLPAGKYEVRFKADNNHYASGANVFEIAEGPCASADGTWYKTEGSNGAHWQVCRCGKKLNEDTHVFSWEEVKAPTTEKPGLKRYQCSTCGYVLREEEIPPACIGGYVGVYDGNEHAVSVDLKDDATAQFSIDGGVTWKTDAPTIKNVGKTTVDYKVTTSGASDIKGQVTLEVTPLAITVAPAAASKTYGDPDPDFTYEVTAGSLMEGDTLSDITYKRDEGESVLTGYKTYKVTASQKEGANANYDITFEAGEFTITRRTIDVKWTVGQYVYNGQEQGPTAEITNLVNNDDVSLKVVDAAKVNAGMYTAKVTGLVGEDKVLANYRKPSGIECKYAIAKAKRDSAPNVKATAETVSGKHDGTIEGVDTSMQLGKPSKQMMFIKTSDLADGDKLENLAPGSYRLCYGATTNYEASEIVTVTIAAGRKLKVTLPAEQTGYTLTADATELDWHGSATLTISIEDGYFADSLTYVVKVNGGAVTPNERGEFTVQDVEGDVRVTVEGVHKHEAVNDKWLSDDNAHWHECTCGEKIDEAAHTFEWVVDKAPTATEAGSKHQQCTVCGHALPAVEIPAAAIAGYSDEYDGAYHTVDATRLPEGATAQYSTDGKNWSSEAPKIRDVGTLTVSYKVTIDGTTAEGEVTLEVKPCPITVAADDASKTYGEADPVFTWTITSGELVEGESLQGIEIEREDDDNVREGGYALQLTQPEGANPNYSITFVDGAFTINQRLLTVTWGTTEFTYDGKEHCPVATLGNVIGNDDLGATVEGSQTEVGTSYKATLTALTGKAAGNYALPADGLTCEFSIKKAAQDAPKVQAEAETVSGRHDGKIAGVNATMEWRAKGAAEYQAVGEGVTELKDLAAGVYEVRYQAKANYDASSATEITVAAGRKLVVALPTNQQGYTLAATATELDWHGSATLTVSIDSAYFAGKGYAVKVDGKAIELSDKGTYELKDVEGDVNVTVEGVLKHESDGTGWAHDAKNHWHVCRCGDIIDKAEHTFEWVVDWPATVEAKGEKHQECTVCHEKGKTEEIAILAPEITDGKGQTMVVEAAKDLTFRSSAPLEFFRKVLVDGKEVARENYELTEGSTIVTLKASFLNTLGVGEHTLSVVSTTGTAETTFTVAEAAKPAPGQTTTTTTTTTTTSKPKKKAGKETLPESGDSTYVMAGAVLAVGVAALLLAWAMKRRA